MRCSCHQSTKYCASRSEPTIVWNCLGHKKLQTVHETVFVGTMVLPKLEIHIEPSISRRFLFFFFFKFDKINHPQNAVLSLLCITEFTWHSHVVRNTLGVCAFCFSLTTQITMLLTGYIQEPTRMSQLFESFDIESWLGLCSKSFWDPNSTFCCVSDSSLVDPAAIEEENTDVPDILGQPLTLHEIWKLSEDLLEIQRGLYSKSFWDPNSTSFCISVSHPLDIPAIQQEATHVPGHLGDPPSILLEEPIDMEGLYSQSYWNKILTFFCILESAPMDENCQIAGYSLYRLTPTVIRDHWDQALKIIDSYRGLYSIHFVIHIQLSVVSQIPHHRTFLCPANKSMPLLTDGEVCFHNHFGIQIQFYIVSQVAPLCTLPISQKKALVSRSSLFLISAR